jgi:hypothetical protein
MVNSSSRAHRKFVKGRSAFELWRLTDVEYQALREYSFPLRENGLLLMNLRQDDRRSGRWLMLPKLLVALEEDYGEASSNIDSWKQTFSFPFLVKFTKADESWPYLLRLEDYRGSLEFNFYRVVNDQKFAEVRRDAYQEAIDGELGKEEMKYWISFLWGYWYAISEWRCEQKVKMNQISPYFRHIDSNHIVYGFSDGEFFQYQIESEKQYDADVARLRKQYPMFEPSLEEEVVVTQSLVEAIWHS